METREILELLGEKIGDAVVERLERERKIDQVAHRVLARMRDRGLSDAEIDLGSVLDEQN